MTGPGGATPLSPRNPRITSLRRLARRRSARSEVGAAVVEGPTLLAEALDAGLVVHDVFVVDGIVAPPTVERAQAAGAGVHLVRADVLAGAIDVVTPHALAAVVAVPAVAVPSAPTSDEALLVLDAVADPGNVGTLLRSAEAAGLAGVVLGPGCADPWSPKVVRSAAGSLFRRPPAVVDDLPAVLTGWRAGGARSIGASGDGTPVDDVDLSGPVALVVGSEAHGLAPAVAEALDARVAIPMAGAVESLNAAVAGSVLAFELARRRREARR